MTRARVLFALGAAVLFQTFILAQMVLGQISLLNSPTEVVLKTEPVDPRDLFRGDYVILNYEISEIEGTRAQGFTDLPRNTPIYVLLDTSTETATVKSVHQDLPAINANEAVIRGRFSWFDGTGPVGETECEGCSRLFVHYPIDSYFVPEGTGLELEQYRDARALGVIVALNDEGDSAIKGLMIEGEKIYDTPLF